MIIELLTKCRINPDSPRLGLYQKLRLMVATFIVLHTSTHNSLFPITHNQLGQQKSREDANNHERKSKDKMNNYWNKAKRRVGVESGPLDSSETFLISPKLANFYRLYSTTVNTLYVLMVLKCFTVLLLDIDALRELRYVDCLLLGRVSFHGGFIEALRFLVPSSLVIIIASRLYLQVTRIHHPIFNFIIKHSSYLDDQYQHLIGAQELHETLLTDKLSNKSSNYELKLKNNQLIRVPYRQAFVSSNGLLYRHMIKGEQLDRIMFILPEDLMKENKTSERQKLAILRLSRSLDVWCVTLFWSVVFLVAMTVVTLTLGCFYVYVTRPTVVTRKGFELTYSNCVKWIIERNRDKKFSSSKVDGPNGLSQNDYGLDYASIYQPSERQLAPENRNENEWIDRTLVTEILPMENVTSSWYHEVRILMDSFDTLFFVLSGWLMFASHFTLVTSAIFDIIMNTSEVGKRLKSMLHRWDLHGEKKYEIIMEDFQSMEFKLMKDFGTTFPAAELPSSHMCHLRGLGRLRVMDIKAKYYDDERHRLLSKIISQQTGSMGTGEIFELQLLLIDHFKLLRSYSHYVGYYFAFVVAAWACFTASVVIWFGFAGGEGIFLIFYAVQILGTTGVVTCLCVLAYVRGRNRRLYSYVATLMARDANYTETKRLWLQIVDYFTPKPLYCFTLASRTEISFMLIIKVS